MSIDYILYLTRSTPPTAEGREFMRCSSGPVGEPTATWKEEDFGLRPTWSVYFPIDKSDTYASALAMASIVGEVLRQSDDDALLLMNGELPILRRTGGRVRVNSRTWWAGLEERGFFGLPVEIEDLGGVV